MELGFDIRKLRNLPFYGQVILSTLPSVIIALLFIFLIFLPKNEDLTTLGNKIEKLDSEIATSLEKIKRLDSLIAENKVLKAKLSRLQEQLPEEKEVSVLLKQISELGLQSGLKMLLWKPEAKKTEPQGLYVEIPVKVEVLTEYHKLGNFLSHISRLPRLVNISNIVLQTRKRGKEDTGSIINAKFTARTFASTSEQERIMNQAAKAKKK